MDGDRADVPALARLARKFDAFLYLDEAHATGVLGENGFGLAQDLSGIDHLIMGTFSKALGSFGAYAACSATLKAYLLHRCRGLVFATALPPAVLGAIEAALELVPELTEARTRVANHGRRFRTAMADAGLDTGASSTHIVPVLVGTEDKALSLAKELETAGIFAVAIRPPTVPKGTSRVRFSFSARHSPEQVDDLIATVIRWSRGS
jgi:8-amino-7-oxononanoate synthase